MIPSVNSVLKNKNSLRQFGSVIWSSLPIEIREDPGKYGKSGKHCFSQKVLENLGKLELFFENFGTS